MSSLEIADADATGPEIDSTTMADLLSACIEVDLPPVAIQQVFEDIGVQYLQANPESETGSNQPGPAATYVIHYNFRAYIPSNSLDTTFPSVPYVYHPEPFSSTKYFKIDPRNCGEDGSSRIDVFGSCWTIDIGSNGIFPWPQPDLAASAGISAQHDTSTNTTIYETSSVIVRRSCRDTGPCQSTATARVTGVYPFVSFPLNSGNFLVSVSCTFNIRFEVLSPGVVLCVMWGSHTRFPNWDGTLGWDETGTHPVLCYTTPDSLPSPEGLSTGVDFQSAVTIIDFGSFTSPGCN